MLKRVIQLALLCGLTVAVLAMPAAAETAEDTTTGDIRVVPMTQAELDDLEIAGDRGISIYTGKLAAQMVFVDDGDWFYVWDRKSDSHGVWGAHYQYWVGGWNIDGEIQNNKGAGTYRRYQRNIYNWNRYYMRVCLTEKSVIISKTCVKSSSFSE